MDATPRRNILFVCSLGQIRSFTASTLCLMGGAMARHCGADLDRAMAPANVRLLRWADIVFCMERTHVRALRKHFGDLADRPLAAKPLLSLGLEDIYEPFEPQLMADLGRVLFHHDEHVAECLMVGAERFNASGMERTLGPRKSVLFSKPSLKMPER